MSEIQENERVDWDEDDNSACHVAVDKGTVKNCEETTSELRKFARVIADVKAMFDELEIYGSLDEECRQRMEKKLCCDIDEIADHYFDLGQKDIQKGLQKLLGIRF